MKKTTGKQRIIPLIWRPVRTADEIVCDYAVNKASEMVAVVIKACVEVVA
jgi:hypothetical protein